MFGRQPHIFISYRRDDSAVHARALYEELEGFFGKDRLFFDVENVDYGDRFAGWLAAHDEADARADAALAAFDWARNAAFDAADTPVLAADAWRTVPADAWATLTLRPIAAVRLLDLPGRVLDDTTAPPTAADTRTWLLWRESCEVRWRVIDTDEARALRDVIAGEAGLATLCAAAVPDDADAMARAIGWLKRWLHDGLIAAFAS